MSDGARYPIRWRYPSLRDQLVSDEVSIIKYAAAKPDALLEEDKLIGAMKLNIRPGKVTITPVEEVFAR